MSCWCRCYAGIAHLATRCLCQACGGACGGKFLTSASAHCFACIFPHICTFPSRRRLEEEQNAAAAEAEASRGELRALKMRHAADLDRMRSGGSGAASSPAGTPTKTRSLSEGGAASSPSAADAELVQLRQQVRPTTTVCHIRIVIWVPTRRQATICVANRGMLGEAASCICITEVYGVPRRWRP